MIRGSGIFGLFDINFDDIIARFRREPAVIQFLTGNFISLIIIKLPIDDIISIDLSIVRCHFSGYRVKLEVNIRVDRIFLCPVCGKCYIITGDVLCQDSGSCCILLILAKKCITFSYRVGGNYKRLVILVAFCSP